MNVKKYIANSPQEAMELIRKEQGGEAVILSTKTIRQKGIRGYFARPMVEFVVAFNENSSTHSQKHNGDIKNDRSFINGKNFLEKFINERSKDESDYNKSHAGEGQSEEVFQNFLDSFRRKRDLAESEASSEVGVVSDDNLFKDGKVIRFNTDLAELKKHCVRKTEKSKEKVKISATNAEPAEEKPKEKKAVKSKKTKSVKSQEPEKAQKQTGISAEETKEKSDAKPKKGVKTKAVRTPPDDKPAQTAPKSDTQAILQSDNHPPLTQQEINLKEGKSLFKLREEQQAAAQISLAESKAKEHLSAAKTVEGAAEVISQPVIMNAEYGAGINLNSILNLQSDLMSKMRDVEKKISNIGYLTNGIYSQMDSNGLSDGIAEMYEFLVQKGISRELALKICTSESIKNSCDVRLEVKNILLSSFMQIKKLKPSGEGCSAALFLGSRGSGRTSSMLKIAADERKNNGKSVCLFSTDIYKIGELESLTAYSKILNLDLYAKEQDKILSVVNETKNNDYLFIDTPGRSASHSKYGVEVQKIISLSKPQYIYLVVNSTLSIENLKDTAEFYSHIEDYQIILTKLDEAVNKNIIFDIVDIFKRPIAYVSDSENVLDGMKVLDHYNLINQLFHE